jgi:dUTP pyrophosphatase
MMMFLKYKLFIDKENNRGLCPRVMTVDAACADLVIPYEFQVQPKCYRTESLLIGFDIPIDWCLYIQPRSSTFSNRGLLIPTGIIDSDYKGEVHIQIFNMNDDVYTAHRGDRLVQVQIFQKQHIQFEEVHELPNHGLSRATYIGSTGV